jgi:acyl-CoA thioesterase FadM
MHEDQFTMIEDIAGPGEVGSRHHLIDYQTQELVSTLWSKYLANAGSGLAPTAVMPAMRRVSYALDNEAFAGDQLQRGIKAVGRSRRSCTFAVAVWHAADGRMVHSGEIVTVFVEPGKGAVEVPADFWAEVEKIEGQEIPVTERAT